MNDLDLLDRFGPHPTPLSGPARDVARARLDRAIGAHAGRDLRPQGRPHPHLPSRRLLAAAAAVVVGAALVPTLTGGHRSPALAAVDPLTFPVTPTELPVGLGEPVFERDHGVATARYGPALAGVSIVTGVDSQDHWAIPAGSPSVEVDGHRATVVRRTVHGGTTAGAAAVSVIWRGDDGDWTAVTGSGPFADDGRVASIARSLRDRPQSVDLTLSLAPRGWAVASYRSDRVVTLADGHGTGPDELTVTLVDRPSADLREYGVASPQGVTVQGRDAWIGRQGEPDAGPWVLEATTSTGQPFSVQAPSALTREQVVRIADGVDYRG